MADTFLPYFEHWEENVERREGFDASQKLLSSETRLGLKITSNYWLNLVTTKVTQNYHTSAKSFIGLVKLIFSLPEVKGQNLAFLSMNICWDPLENYFGCQRQRGGSNDNPNAAEFHHNTQALRVVNGLCRNPVKGNCRGASGKGNKPVTHDFEEACRPIPRRGKKTK